MDVDEKIEERKRYNEPFIRAFNYLLEQKVAITKGQLCSMIGIQPGLISNYTKGTKRVSGTTMESLVRVSRGKININFLLGISQYMLLENVPEGELAEIIIRKTNPDYDVMEKRRLGIEKEIESIINPQKDENTKEDLIRTLRTQVDDIRIQLNDKERIIETKDQLIKSLYREIEFLNQKVAQLQAGDVLHNHPFPIGVADDSKLDPNRV